MDLLSLTRLSRLDDTGRYQDREQAMLVAPVLFHVNDILLYKLRYVLEYVASPLCAYLIFLLCLFGLHNSKMTEPKNASC